MKARFNRMKYYGSFGQKMSKYKNVRQTYDGYSYHSKKEAEYAAKLDWMKKAGEVTKWERQVKISLDVNGVHIANYFIDFKVYYKNGKIEFWEVKGMETDIWRMKFKLTKALYPEYKLVVLK